MSVTINAKGTSVPFFKIGKNGTTLYQGASDPTISYTVSNGDYWLDSSSNQLKTRISGSWLAPKLNSLTFPTGTGTTGQVLVTDGAGNLSFSTASGTGTVTSVSVTTANGVSGTVATSTTTPAITLTLGAITPSSVAATGTVTGSNLSGTNTGDQTITLTGDITGSGTGSFATTLATVNSTPGSFGSSTTIPVITVNSKGLITSVSTAANPQGTVTSVTVSGANGIGVTGSPITSSGTISLSLGAITPTSVAATGTLSGSNFSGSSSGTNTGDQTITLTGDVTGSGTGSFATTLATVNSSPQTNTFTKTTVNSKGLTTATSPVTSSDITTVLGYTPAVVAGANTQVQFNNSGVLGASHAFTFTNDESTGGTGSHLSLGYSGFDATLSVGNISGQNGILELGPNANIQGYPSGTVRINSGRSFSAYLGSGTYDTRAGGSLYFLTGDITDPSSNNSTGAYIDASGAEADSTGVTTAGGMTLSAGSLASALNGSYVSPATIYVEPLTNSSGTISGGRVILTAAATSVSPPSLELRPTGLFYNNNPIGTVTSVSASGAQGVTISGSPITSSGTITVGLGAITPTSVAATGTVTGSNLSGTNTGDQTITLTGDVTGSGTGSFAATLATVNSSPQTNTFTKTTINGKGLTTATSPVTSTDITTTLGYTPVNKNGDTMTGLLILSGDPTNVMGAVTKQYADNIAAGVNIHYSCRTGTTTNLSATYNNGASGVGATLTGTGALPTIGGVTLSVNDRVLVKDQTSLPQNGIYVVTQTTANWILTRSADFDGTPATEITSGDMTYVQEGTNGGTQWVVTAATGTIVVGTSNIIWTQFAGSGTYTAGTGISIATNTISNTGVTSAVAGSNISVSSATGAVTIAVTGTVPTATTATNISGGTAGNVPYQTGAGATSFVANAAGVLQAATSGATPTWTTTPTLTGTNFSGIPISALVGTSPWTQSVTAAPYPLGNYNSITTAFSGDISKIIFPTKYSISGASTLGTPTTGYQYTPEASPFYVYVNNTSGYNNSTSSNDGRTAATAFRTQIANYGQGDMVAYNASGFVTGTKTGSTNFLANPAASLFNGDLTAGQDGVYLNPYETYLTDNGFDVAGLGIVNNFYRTVSTGAKGVWWGGYRAQSVGTASLDNLISADGKFVVGLDLTMSSLDFGTTKAAVSLKANDRIYLNNTAGASGNLTANCRTTTFNGDYLEYNSGISGLNVVIGNSSILQVNASQVTSTVSIVGSNLIQGLTLVVNAPASTSRQLRYQTATSDRWHANANATPESGSNVGSDYVIERYSDSGTLLGTPLTITRSTGLVTLASGLTVTGTVTGTTFSGSGASLTSIPNSALTNSSVTIGSTNISLGATSTTLAGLTSVTSTTVSINGVGTLGSATLTTSTTTANQVVDANPIATYRAVSYKITVTSGSAYEYTEVRILHDGTNTYTNEINTMLSGAALATFSADISGGNMRLLVTPVNAATTIKAVSTLIVV